jgi:hypothetical protein
MQTCWVALQQREAPMYPFSPIRIVEKTPSRLVIVDPPFYLAGGMFALVSVGMAALSLWKDSDVTPVEQIGWPALILALPFLVITAALLGGSTRLVLSRETRLFAMDKRYFWFFAKRMVMPLDELRSASVVNSDWTRQLQLQLSSGAVVTTGSLSDRRGYTDAANAINEFLQP